MTARMNISHRKRYHYFVVPKCGSRTIRTSLQSHTDIGYPVDDFPQHMTVSQFMATDYASLLSEYFAFTFVRNPYDRLYSGYMQDRYAAAHYPEWTEVKQPIFDRVGDDFNRYVREYACLADTSRCWDYVCFWPMTDFAVLDGEWRLNWYGRVECLERDLASLAHMLGIECEVGESLNVRVPATGQLKYLDKYERATVELVNQYYRDDFEQFSYELLDPSDFPREVTG